MDILIVAHFTQAPNEKGNGRFHYLANLLLENKESENDVEIVTTSFSHRLKEQRQLTQNELETLNYKFVTCFEPGYARNVCLKRFYSHFVYGRHLKKYLEQRKKPDVIYCAVPSLDAAYAAMCYAKKNQIRFVVDVQDIWPEAFEMVFHVPILSQMIFAPMKWMVNKIYANADEIVAVSDTYTKRVKAVNHKAKETHSVFLGTELMKFDMCVKNNPVQKDETEIWLGYCGTLGHSYDLKCVIDAMELLKKQGITNIKFVVMGDGPLKSEFEQYARRKQVNAEFTGRLEYDKMCGILAVCDIAMNVISHRAAQSIINKHADYAAAGIPVISTQENEEYKALVESYHMGYNCLNSNAEDLAQKICMLIQDKNLREQMGLNARRCAKEKFDRKRTYQEIVDVIQAKQNN